MSILNQEYHEHNNVVNIFETIVSRYPDRVALKQQNDSVTYKQLNDVANMFANLLLAEKIRLDTIIGIKLDRSFSSIISILAILKAGAAFLIIDQKCQKDRLDYIIKDAKISSLITEEKYLDEFRKYNKEIYTIDKLLTKNFNLFRVNHVLDIAIKNSINLQKYDSTNPINAGLPRSLSYIIYTSGSTGQPKAVMIENISIFSSFLSRIKHYPERNIIGLLSASLSFDSAITSIFWPLLTGGTVVIPLENKKADIDYIVKLIKKFKVTHIQVTPSLYGLLLKEERYVNSLSTLKNIDIAGEVCPNHVLLKHKEILPKAALWNEYGPTEASIWSSTARLNY